MHSPSTKSISTVFPSALKDDVHLASLYIDNLLGGITMYLHFSVSFCYLGGMKVTSHTTTVCSVAAREELVEDTNNSEDTLSIDEVGTPESIRSIEKSSIDLPSPSIELNFQPADSQADFQSSFDKYSAQLTNTTHCANTRALLILELVLPKSLQPASFSTTWVKAWHGKLFQHLHWPKDVLILAQQPAFLAK